MPAPASPGNKISIRLLLCLAALVAERTGVKIDPARRNENGFWAYGFWTEGFAAI